MLCFFAAVTHDFFLKHTCSKCGSPFKVFILLVMWNTSNLYTSITHADVENDLFRTQHFIWKGSRDFIWKGSSTLTWHEMREGVGAWTWQKPLIPVYKLTLKLVLVWYESAWETRLLLVGLHTATCTFSCSVLQPLGWVTIVISLLWALFLAPILTSARNYYNSCLGSSNITLFFWVKATELLPLQAILQSSHNLNP